MASSFARPLRCRASVACRCHARFSWYRRDDGVQRACSPREPRSRSGWHHCVRTGAATATAVAPSTTGDAMARTVQEKRAAFRALHAEGCFVLPNPWDIGSARMLQGLGFQALASTSSGFAWSTGGADGTSSRDAVLAHLRALCEATDLPVNADFESGYAANAEGVAESVRMCIATGVAGLSIEDSTGDREQPLRDVAEAVERLRAARAAIDGSGGDTILVGRAENFIVGRPDLADTIARL